MNGGELLRATLFHTPGNPFHDPGALRCHIDGGLLVRDGRIVAAGDYETVSAAIPTATTVDWRGGFVLPGLIDTHVHFPQLRILGGLGRSLLDWLEQVALPEEARMADLAYAQDTARRFVHALAAHGTTTALVFGAHFAPATASLFEQAAAVGLRIVSGLVLSDRLLRSELCQSPRDAYRDSTDLIRRFHRRGRLLYAVTPRFALSTSEAMLEVCQTLTREHEGLLIQTHLNENLDEVAELRRLFSWTGDYLGVYERYGLAAKHAVMAHNVWPTDSELERLAASGTSVAHCPASNAALGSGIFPFSRHISAGVHCALGTDVGGGIGFGLLKEALQAHLMQRVAPGGAFLDPARLLYLATRAGAEAVGLDDQIGDFQPGKAADLVYLRPPTGSPLADVLERVDSAEQALAALFVLAGVDSVREVRVAGSIVFGGNKTDLTSLEGRRTNFPQFTHVRAKEGRVMMLERMTVNGSRRIPLPGATRVGPTDPHERVEATIVVKRRLEAQSAIGGSISRADFAAAHGAHPADIEAVTRFAADAGLTVVETDRARLILRVAGPADTMKAAFGTNLSYYDSPRGRYRGRVGALTLPADVAPLVDAVLGLDDRPTAEPHLRKHPNPEAAAAALLPTQVAKAYSFPTGVDGSGQTIGIIELGGGFKPADLATYFTSLKIQTPQVSAVGVLSGTNNPGVDTNSDGEVMLDIEVAGSVAPGARIVVYFAPNTDQGFLEAITTAVHDSANNPSVVSISWGGPESSWTQQAMTVMNAALQDAATLGVTVTVAAGDNGSTDGVKDGKDHVDFPASSPFALACGGTRLELSSTGAIASETVWNDLPNNGATGGGFSDVFPLPSYQTATNAAKQGKMRGVPDVAGNADPFTGYRVLVDGSPEVIGGTSAVAPLWAGLVALINQQSHASVGFWHPALYAQSAVGFHDITQGNNGAFKAGPGWDANTGIGTPDGRQLMVSGAGVVTT